MSEHFGYRDEDVHALSGAYAVDALDEHERARFEEHLRVCPDCRDEVDSLREAAATLGGDLDVAPPPELRDAVLAGIETVRPLPPLAPPAEDDLAARRRGFRFGTPLLVAAVLALIVAVGATWLQPWEGDEPPARPTATERVLDAEDATRSTKELPDGSRATVVVSRSEGRAVILTEDMAPAPADKVYELWLQAPSGDLHPAGLMPDDSDATVLLDGDASEAIGVGITVEPDGGSEQPTSEPIAFFALDA